MTLAYVNAKWIVNELQCWWREYCEASSKAIVDEIVFKSRRGRPLWVHKLFKVTGEHLYTGSHMRAHGNDLVAARQSFRQQAQEVKDQLSAKAKRKNKQDKTIREANVQGEIERLRCAGDEKRLGPWWLGDEINAFSEHELNKN
jgi:hypothetical protein